VIDEIPQLSELALAIDPALTLTCPLNESKFTVGLEQIAIGAETSLTVIVVLQVAAFPEGSETVTVCVLAPKSAQVNAVLGIVADVPQLSILPEDTLDALTLTFPKESTLTVGLEQTAVGAVTSLTVMVVLQVAVLPEMSFKVTI
jgi:hypothetical protein